MGCLCRSDCIEKQIRDLTHKWKISTGALRGLMDYIITYISDGEQKGLKVLQDSLPGSEEVIWHRSTITSQCASLEVAITGRAAAHRLSNRGFENGVTFMTCSLARTMATHSLLRAFKSNKPAFGAWVMLPGAFNARTVARSSPNLSWIVIDCEHGLTSLQPGTAKSIQAIQGIGAGAPSSIVRIPATGISAETGWQIKYALDAGARGILVPMVCLLPVVDVSWREMLLSVV